MEMKIGARLARLRRKKGLTQEQLAEKPGISAPAVSKWETDIIEKVNSIIETARDKGAAAGEKEILDLLHKYPDSVPLKFYAAIAWDTFFLFFPTIGDETKNRWTALKKELFTEVRLSGTGAYWQTTTLRLDAADCLERYVDALTGPALLPKPFLFSPGLSIKKDEARPASSAELRQMLLKGLEGEQYHEFLQQPRCQRALEKLRASL